MWNVSTFGEVAVDSGTPAEYQDRLRELSVSSITALGDYEFSEQQEKVIRGHSGCSVKQFSNLIKLGIHIQSQFRNEKISSEYSSY